MRPRLFIELFAGTASTSLRLLGGRRLEALYGYMGSKARYATPILNAMGLRPQQGADAVMLVDAGPPGWMWQWILIPEIRERVSAILRSWESPDPDHAAEQAVALWHRLAANSPPDDLAEGIATWAWLQARSANSCPVWWDDEKASWRMGDKPRSGLQKDVVQRGDWRAGAEMARGGENLRQKGIGVPGEQRAQQAPNLKVEGPTRCRGMVHPSTIALRLDRIAHHLASYVCLQAGSAMGKPVVVEGGAWKTHGYGHLSESAKSKGWKSRLRPELLAARVDDLVALGAGERTTFIAGHARVEDLQLEGDLEGVYALMDPDYKGCTGYATSCPTDSVLAIGKDLAARGAVVAICEARPLDIPGWSHVELTGYRKGQVFPKGRAKKGEWLTLSRPPARVPARQLSMGLLAAGGAA